MKSITISNNSDEIIFQESELGNPDEVDICINGLYLTSITKNNCEPRAWDELLNLGNKTPTDVVIHREGTVKESWLFQEKDLDKSGSRV